MLVDQTLTTFLDQIYRMAETSGTLQYSALVDAANFIAGCSLEEACERLRQLEQAASTVLQELQESSLCS